MANELLIDVGLTETRVALVEDDRLVHLDLERPDRDSALGAIFLGRVRLIEPGLQAAYVDIGLARDGFLNASDLAPDLFGDNSRPIEQRLAEGDAILVQVIRDPVGEKGVKLTARPSLPGRFLSLTPYDSRIRVSKRILEDAERMRLAALLQSMLGLADQTPAQVSLKLRRKLGERRVGKSASPVPDRRGEDRRPPMGALVEMAAEKADQEALGADLQRLRARWIAIEERRAKATAPAELWREMGPVGRALRNHVGAKLDTIRVNDARGFAEARAWLFEHAPELVGKLERYDEPGALFELFDIESDIDAALSRRVALPSGGALLFGETDALTAIDVDIARGARRGNDFEELALRINLDAAEEIARQLRLRGIGGIIVIDFLHMDSSAYRAQAVNALRNLEPRSGGGEGARHVGARPGGDDAQAYRRAARHQAVRGLPDLRQRRPYPLLARRAGGTDPPRHGGSGHEPARFPLRHRLRAGCGGLVRAGPARPVGTPARRPCRGAARGRAAARGFQHRPGELK